MPRKVKPKLTFRLMALVERLYSVTFPGTYRMARYFSMNYPDFIECLKELSLLNFKFKFLIDLPKLDLRKTYVLLDKPVEMDERIPFLRSYVVFIPNMTYMAFYTPLKVDSSFFVRRILEQYGIKRSDIKEVFVAKYVEENRALLLYYKWSPHDIKCINEESEWRKIADKTGVYLNYYSVNKPPEPFDEYRGPKILRGDYLRILRVLEYEPFIQLHEVAKKAGVDRSVLIKAVRLFEYIGVFRGLRLRRTPWIDYADLYFLAFLKSNKYEHGIALLQASAEFPLFTGGIVDSDNRVLLSFRGTGQAFSAFEKLLNKLEDEYGYRVEKTFVGFAYKSKKYSIPYIQGVEYDKYRRYWNIYIPSSLN